MDEDEILLPPPPKKATPVNTTEDLLPPPPKKPSTLPKNDKTEAEEAARKVSSPIEGFVSSIGSTIRGVVTKKIPEALASYVQRKVREEAQNGEYTPEEQARLDRVVKNSENFIQKQEKDYTDITKGIPQSYKDVNTIDDFAKYVGGLTGQSAGQIVPGLVSGGASSYLQESQAVYRGQLERIAKNKGLTVPEVIENDLDDPAAGQAYAVAATGLEMLSNLGLTRPLSGFKGWLRKTLVETATEPIQGILEDKGAGYDLAETINSKRIDEALGGFVGGGITSAITAEHDERAKIATAELTAEKAIDESSTGDPEIDAQIDEAAKIDPVDKAALEEVKVSKAVQENQAEVEKQEKLEESLQEPEKETSEGPKEKELKPSETPEYKEAVAKVEALQKKFAELPIDENADELLFDLREARQSLQKIAAEQKPSSKKTDIKSRIEDTTGVTKPKKSVQMTPNEAIKHQVQTFYKGVEEGVYRGKDASNQLLTKVQEAMKDSPLQPKQINSILTKVRNTNLFTPGSISRLNSFIDKVSADADYGAKIDEAKSLNKSLRKLSKNKSNLQNVRTVAKQFASINPEDTFINQHLEEGRKIFNALASPTKANYEAVDVPATEEYVNDLKSKIETEDVAREPKEESTKLKQLKISLRSAVEALKNKDLSEFDDSEKSRIESIKNIDPEKLDEKRAQTAIKVIDNIVENDDFSNISSVESVAKAQQVLADLKAKLSGKKIEKIGTVGKLFNNTPQLFRQIYDNSKIAADVQSGIGTQDLFAAGSRVENKESQRSHDYSLVAKEYNKTTGDDIRSIDNQVKLAVFGLLYRHVKGGDPTVHISKILGEGGNIERTIKTYEKAGKEADAAAWQKAYDQFKNVTTPEEALKVMEKTPELLKAYQFFPNMFAQDINEGLRAVTEEVHNKPYVEEENYTSIGIENVSSNIKAKESFSEGDVNQAAKIKPTQAKTSIAASRNLPPGFAYSSDFVGTQFKAYQQSLYDIEASRTEALLKEILYSPEFEEIVGGFDNAKLIQDQIKTGRDIQAGVLRKSTNLAVKAASGLTQYIRSIGAAKALGSSIGAVLKQSLPVLTKAMVNHIGSKSSSSFYRGLATKITPNVRKLLNNSQIGVRRKRQGGTERGEQLSHRLGIRKQSRFLNTLERIGVSSDWLTHKSLWALTTTDATIAERTFIGYYLQRLNELGVKDVNMDQEFSKQNDPNRKKAIAFAEQMISETQLPSNPAELSSVSRNDRNESLNILKNILLPFANYSLNAKRRLMLDASSAFRNPTRANVANVAGDMAEIMAFAAIQVYIMGMYKDAIKSLFEKMVGIEPPDKDEEKEAANKLKAFSSNVANSVIPTSIGTVGENYTAKAINALGWLVTNPEGSFKEWKKETGGLVYEKDAVDYGLLSIGASPLVEGAAGAIDLTKNKLGEPIIVDDFMGNPKEIYLNEDQQTALEAKTLIELMSAAGLNEADIFNQIRKTYKEQIRMGNSEGTKSNRSHRPAHKRRIPRRSRN